MNVSASIVTYKTDREELKKCLDSLFNNGVSLVYIVDNSPTDALSVVAEGQDDVVYIFNGENVGYSRGHNVAIRKVLEEEPRSDYHLVLNSDVYFDDDVISKIVRYMDENRDVAQLIPNVVYPNGNPQYVVRLLPTPLNQIFRRYLPSFMVKGMNRRYCLEFDDHKHPINAPFLFGCFMFFRTSCFDKVGLFDERYFLYVEDIDITRRMHRQYRTMFWPGATIVHTHRGASYKSLRMMVVHAVNMVRYFNKWGWIFDKERTEWNNKLLNELGYKK